MLETKLIKIHLCDGCLAGKGEECHTPGCALYLHNSPGFEIDPQQYEVVEEEKPAKTPCKHRDSNGVCLAKTKPGSGLMINCYDCVDLPF